MSHTIFCSPVFRSSEAVFPLPPPPRGDLSLCYTLVHVSLFLYRSLVWACACCVSSLSLSLPTCLCVYVRVVVVFLLTRAIGFMYAHDVARERERERERELMLRGWEWNRNRDTERRMVRARESVHACITRHTKFLCHGREPISK